MNLFFVIHKYPHKNKRDGILGEYSDSSPHTHNCNPFVVVEWLGGGGVILK